ncbi:hypothetical protein N0V93_004543 [Gnomoniopsis smithogilvyi]|uniref:Short-chain dehydrogenase n=1 Tax=Gnomoniopsis smithogilvyi TaxID=1191159 RepID=A0A9W8YV03_9PEZI|nr:hypothetical protein N0V93_004543 [Gnomoniopsis smithogilvyi]
MARIFITGSSDGLGALTAQRLISQGHQVVLHARNAARAADAQKTTPGAAACLVGDLSSLTETKALAAAANDHGPYDCVLHNAALGTRASSPALFHVNVLAPYVLTCLMERPKRLVYISSGLHRSGRARLDSLEGSGYSDTKLHDIMLAKAFARRWEGLVESNAANPGWVPTKMGGSGAPGDIGKSVDTFAMLAVGEGAAKGVSGKYFQDSEVLDTAEVADDVGLQDELLKKLAEMSGIEVPR